MEALKETEQDHAGLGQSMLSTLFPGRSREAEISFWEKAKETQKAQGEQSLATTHESD